MDASPLLALTGALLLLVVPGGILGHVAGIRGLAWLATAPVLTVAGVGATGVVMAPLHIPFAWWQTVVVLIAAAAVVVAVRGLRHRRPTRPLVGRWTRGDVVACAVVVVAAVVAGVIASAGIGPWDHISQTYDGMFHLNAVAYIQTTGDASSFDLYRITHPGTTDNEFYPAAWHALVASTVQVTGASIPVATNAVWFAVQSAIWMPGIAFFAAAVAPARHRALAASVAAAAAVGLIGFPDLLLAWGTLYPTALAYALLPVGLVTGMRVMSWVALRPTDRRLPVPWHWALILVAWVIASALAHPRSLFGFVVLLAPLVVIEAGRAMARIWRRPAWRRRLVVTLVAFVAAVLAVAVVGVIYVYRTYDVAHRPISDHLNGGPATATEGPVAALVQALTLAPPSPSGSGQLPASWLLAALVIVGLVVAVVDRRMRWVAISFALVVALYVLAAGSNSDLAKVLTGVWYKDKFRLFALLPIVQAVIVAVLVTRVSLLWRASSVRIGGIATTGVAVVVVAAGVASSNVVTAAPAMIGPVFALPAHDKRGALLDADEQKLLQELPRLTPPGSVIAGDPWDGSALSWAIGDRPALFPHFTGEWSPDQLLVAGALDQVRSNPDVCAAVTRLGIHFVVEDPQLLWGNPVEAVPFAGFHRAVQTGVLEPVARVGSAGLYRIPECTS